MSAFRKIRDELAAIFREPEPETPEQAQARLDAAIAADEAARRADDLKQRITYAQRLAPFTGKLFMTTDFGPFEGGWKQHTRRTVDALQAAGLGRTMAVGTSVHLSPTREEYAKDWQFGTQDAITSELQIRGYESVLPPRKQHHDYRFDPLRRMLTLATEDTARRVQSSEWQGPRDFGHIAVVAAYEMKDVDVLGPYPTDGTLFVLRGVDTEQGRLNWQQLAADPRYGS